MQHYHVLPPSDISQMPRRHQQTRNWTGTALVHCKLMGDTMSGTVHNKIHTCIKTNQSLSPDRKGQKQRPNIEKGGTGRDHIRGKLSYIPHSVILCPLRSLGFHVSISFSYLSPSPFHEQLRSQGSRSCYFGTLTQEKIDSSKKERYT